MKLEPNWESAMKTVSPGDCGHHPDHTAGAAAAIDPVCGMTADPHTAKHRAVYQGYVAPLLEKLELCPSGLGAARLRDAGLSFIESARRLPRLGGFYDRHTS
jgi:hypothetical protein